MKEKSEKSGLFPAFERFMGKFTEIVMGASVIGIFLLVIVQVFFRYVLKKSLGGAEELPVYIMACMVWLATPYVTMKDAHVNIELVPQMFSEKVQCGFRIFGNVVAALAMGVFSYLAVEYVQKTASYGTVTGGLGIPVWIFHAVIAYGAIMTALFSAINVFKYGRRLVKWESN